MFVDAIVAQFQHWRVLWVKGGEERKRQKDEPFALHVPIQWAIYGDVIKKRGRSNVLWEAGLELVVRNPS